MRMRDEARVELLRLVLRGLFLKVSTHFTTPLLSFRTAKPWGL
jgi:hypothetical protein